MKNLITVRGRIIFDPPSMTKKHERQGNWKKHAIVIFEGDLAEYYAWFIKKRYNLPLLRPMRGSHVSFIADKGSDMNGKWSEVKKKWHGKEIDVVLCIDPRTDSDYDKGTAHWWLTVPEEHRTELHAIREELGLGRPYWGLHMSIGAPSEKYIDHSRYIHDLIRRGFIRFD